MIFSHNDLRALLLARPFVPFRLILSDGGSVVVPTPEVVSVGRRFALVGLLDPSATDSLFDRWTVVWYIHVTRAEMLDSGAPPFAAPPNSPEQPAPTR